MVKAERWGFFQIRFWQRVEDLFARKTRSRQHQPEPFEGWSRRWPTPLVCIIAFALPSTHQLVRVMSLPHLQPSIACAAFWSLLSWLARRSLPPVLVTPVLACHSLLRGSLKYLGACFDQALCSACLWMIFGRVFDHFPAPFGGSSYHRRSVEIAAALLKIGPKEST